MEDKSIVCYEKWNLERFEHIKQLNLPKEISSQLHKVRIEPGVPRFRVRYSTKKGDALSRVYGNLVYHGPAYKKRKVMSEEGYVYESTDHEVIEEYPGGCSLQGLPTWVRRLIASEYYRDFDLVNCAPVILQQILEKNGIVVPAPLRHYNENRQALFDKYAHFASPTEIKKNMLKVLHMGEEDVRFKEAVLLKRSLRQALYQLKERNLHYKELYRSRLLKVNTKAKYAEYDTYSKITKALGKFCAVVWQREEHKVLMAMRDYFVAEIGRNPFYQVLCFDGLMLEKDDEKDQQQPVDLVNLSEHILKTTGYVMKVIEKSMTPLESDWDIYYGKTTDYKKLFIK